MLQARLVAVSILSLSICIFSAMEAKAGGFQGLGDLPGGIFDSSASGVSADGTVVSGTSVDISNGDDHARQAFKWTAAGGMVGLGAATNGNGISSDGAIVVGNCYATGASAYWDNGGTMRSLGSTSSSADMGSSWAIDASADGSVIVGDEIRIWFFTENAEQEAFRWTSASGMVGLGYLPGMDSSMAFAVSDDGVVVVGFCANSNQTSGTSERAFRWTPTGGMQSLGLLPDASNSTAMAVSADGLVVAGTSGGSAFRWTAADGMVSIGSFTPGDVSSDGSVIVGSSSGQVIIWDAVNSMRDLKVVLEHEHALDLSGWTLGTGSGISADGMTIVGYGTNPDGNDEAWIANISNPPCLFELTGDLDGNCVVDLGDFAQMASNWLINCRQSPENPSCIPIEDQN